MISASEKQYIEDGVAQGFRSDGRAILDYRPVFVRSGVVAQADGSCRVRCGDSEILGGAKLDLKAPNEQQPGNHNITTEKTKLVNYSY